MPSFTVKLRWTDQTQQGGGEDEFRFGKGSRYKGGNHDAVYCGEQGIACGGPENPKLDGFVREGLNQKVKYGVVGVDEVEMTMQQATIAKRAEHLLFVFDDGKGNLSYSNVIKGGFDEVGGGAIEVPRGSKIVASIHTHPVGPYSIGETDTFSVLDVNMATKSRTPVYTWSMSTGDVLAFTPAAGRTPANIRALPE